MSCANTATNKLPSAEEEELYVKFCKSKAVNHTHPLLNFIFGLLPALLALSVYASMSLDVLPSPNSMLPHSV